MSLGPSLPLLLALLTAGAPLVSEPARAAVPEVASAWTSRDDGVHGPKLWALPFRPEDQSLLAE
jgi:hypothetical protein